MTLLSSHVLDSVLGDHAKQIRIAGYHLMGETRIELFDVIANEEGRIAEQVDVPADAQCELVFFTADYFAQQTAIPPTPQIMQQVVVRITVPENSGRIHIPMMISPHSYNIWWSA